MVRINSTHILAQAPAGASHADSVTVGGGSTWVEYGNGADSTGASGSSTVVQYGATGRVENSYSIAGSVDGLKYDPVTGNVWTLVNQDGNSTLRFIDPRTNQLSTPLSYDTGYTYGAASSRGFDDVVFDGKKVFLSETNPANPGDPVIVQLLNGTAPVGTLETTGILSFGDTGTNLTTGATNQVLPITDPDSLKLLPNGSLILTGEADHTLIFVKDPGTAHQSASFIQLPASFTADDAIVPSASSGTFTIANGGAANDVVTAHVTGLNTSDVYADISSLNELVQIDPATGVITPILTGLSSPHGLAFTAAATASAPTLSSFIADIKAHAATDVLASLAAQDGPTVTGTHILAQAPAGASHADSVTVGGGSTWVEYGNGADSTGASGSSTVVQYGATGRVENSYSIAGSVDGLKYDPVTGNVWALVNQDGNSTLRFIDPRTNQLSAPLSYGTGYTYGAASSRGFDDVVFDGKKVFLSETNPANPGDPVIVQLLNGTAPVGTLETTGILSFGDTGTNLTTGATNQVLPITDPDSLKLLPNGSLILTGEADHTLIFVKDPGTAHQSASFIQLPASFTADDAIVPSASSGTFTIANGGAANDVVTAHVTGLNTSDVYADISSLNELVQIDPATGVITPILTGLSSPHGLAFTADTTTPTASPAIKDIIATAVAALKPQLTKDFSTYVANHGGSVTAAQVDTYAGKVAQLYETAGFQHYLSLTNHA